MQPQVYELHDIRAIPDKVFRRAAFEALAGAIVVRVTANCPGAIPCFAEPPVGPRPRWMCPQRFREALRRQIRPLAGIHQPLGAARSAWADVWTCALRVTIRLVCI